MTRRQQKRLTQLIAALIALVIIAGLLTGCGPSYHVKRAEHHIDKAIQKGADIKRDTILFHFKSPEIKFSTTIKPNWIGSFARSLAADTLVATDEKTGATMKAKIDLKDDCPPDCIETVYIYGEVPEQDHTVEVPCETVSAGYTLLEIVIFGLAMIPGGWLIMTFIIVPVVRRLRG